MKGFLAAIGPDAMMRKELFGVSRRIRTYAFRVLYIAIVSLMLWMVWNSVSRYVHYASSSSAWAMASRQMYATFVWVQWMIVGFASIGFSSDLISREVTSGTLGLLVLTPLSPWRIALGKWKSCLAQIFLMVFCGMPIVGVCIFLGGIGPGELLWTSVLTLVWGAFGSAVGLYTSSRASSGWRASIRGLLWLIGWILFPIILGLLVSILGSSSIGDDFLKFWIWVHPCYTLVFLFEPFIGGGAVSKAYLLISSCTVTVALSLIFLRGAARRIPELATAAQPKGAIRRLMQKIDELVERVNLLRVLPFAAGGEVWDRNPVMWKELRTRATGSLRYLTLAAAAVLLLGFLTILASDRSRHFENLGVFILFSILVFVLQLSFVLVSAGSGAALFAKEKDEKKWDLLLVTPLSCRSLIFGKLFGGGSELTGLALCCWLTLIVFPYCLSGGQPIGGLIAASSVLLFALFSFCCGAYCSIWRPTTRSAFSFTMGTVLFLLVIVPILAGVSDFEGLYRATHPTASFEAIGGSHRMDEVFSYFLIYALLYSVASVTMVSAAYRRLRVETGRR